MRLVALYAGNDKDSRLVNTVRLGGFYGCRAAALGSVLVAGANKRELLVRGKVGIECDYNLIGVRNQRGSRIRLQRSQYQRVNARVAERGFNHVDLLIVGRCRRRRLDIYVYVVVLIGVCLCTCHNLVEVAVGQLYDNRDVVSVTAAAAVCGGAAVVARRGAAAARQHTCTQCACQSHR